VIQNNNTHIDIIYILINNSRRESFGWQFYKRIDAKGSFLSFPFVILKQIKISLMKKTAITVIVLIAFILLTACGSAPRFTSRESRFEKRTPPPAENLDRYENTEPLETVKGIASYYADKYDGKITYSGEVYDMYGLSAAHPSYQMGTVIRVTNLFNDKSVIIRINDKMPSRPDRIIDLSLGCAQELDMVNVGIQEVKVEVLEWGKGRK
jgi:rare lipoprotein A